MQARSPARLWILSALLAIGLVAIVSPVLAQPSTGSSAPAAETSASAPGAPAAAAVDKPSSGSADVCAAPPKAKSAKAPEKPLYEKLVPIGVLLVVIVIVARAAAEGRARPLEGVPPSPAPQLAAARPDVLVPLLRPLQHQVSSRASGSPRPSTATVFGVGSAVYGLAFLLNGPLTDRWGGRATILIAAARRRRREPAGWATWPRRGNTFGMSVPTAFTRRCSRSNMYFQSFGAVSIVKVNAAWFHLRERGTFGGIFGILISLGLYFAYDVGKHDHGRLRHPVDRS